MSMTIADEVDSQLKQTIVSFTESSAVNMAAIAVPALRWAIRYSPQFHGCGKVFLMREPIRILTVEKDDGDGLITTFSDGTTAGYVAEELLELRPKRELTEDSQTKVQQWRKAKMICIAGRKQSGWQLRRWTKEVSAENA
jgi:hypothetical protein